MVSLADSDGVLCEVGISNYNFKLYVYAFMKNALFILVKDYNLCLLLITQQVTWSKSRDKANIATERTRIPSCLMIHMFVTKSHACNVNVLRDRNCC